METHKQKEPSNRTERGEIERGTDEMAQRKKRQKNLS